MRPTVSEAIGNTRFAIQRPVCSVCGINEPTGTGNAAAKCDECRAADPNRHRNRKPRAKKQIGVQVDTEGDGKGNITSASFGREDGTSGSIITNDPIEVIKFWMDNLCCDYKGMRQVVGAFHFNYDTAVITKFTDNRLGNMQLIYKTGTDKKDLYKICEKSSIVVHDGKPEKHCDKRHMYNKDDMRDVITCGGEDVIVAWDSQSELAIAATPRRRFYCEERPNGFEFEGRGRILDIHDQGTAFVGGLERVIDEWQPEINQEQRDFIAWGKQARKIEFQCANAEIAIKALQAKKVEVTDAIRRSMLWASEQIANGTGITEMIAAYSEAECVAAAKCTRLLINSVTEAANIRIKLSNLFGSGSLATAAFKKHDLAEYRDTHPDTTFSKGKSEVNTTKIPWFTYFGGMIETPVVGFVNGMTDQEDINSAYPSVMAGMPCMRAGHGKWNYLSKDFNPNRLGITKDTIGHVMVSWIVNTPSTPPFIVRNNEGSVFQPLTGKRVWVTLIEYLTAVKQFGTALITFHKAIWWEQTCDCAKPFAWMQELYEKRLAIKNEMKALQEGSDEWRKLYCQQNAIKLVLNSCYGKLAQRRPTFGTYTNLHYAAHITGGARSKVRERTWLRESRGGIVVYQHTDSCLSKDGQIHKNEVGKQLGQWGLEDPAVDALILQPGLMISLGGGKTATRGVGQEQFDKAARQWLAVNDLTAHPSTWPKIEVPIRRMISRRMAHARGNYELAGQFVDSTMDIAISRYKRNLDRAKPVSGIPGAWIVPPILQVENIATWEDLRKLHKSLIELENNGAFDNDLRTIDFDDYGIFE